jgi:hypothetical protein
LTYGVVTGNLESPDSSRLAKHVLGTCVECKLALVSRGRGQHLGLQSYSGALGPPPMMAVPIKITLKINAQDGCNLVLGVVCRAKLQQASGGDRGMENDDWQSCSVGCKLTTARAAWTGGRAYVFVNSRNGFFDG